MRTSRRCLRNCLPHAALFRTPSPTPTLMLPPPPAAAAEEEAAREAETEAAAEEAKARSAAWRFARCLELRTLAASLASFASLACWMSSGTALMCLNMRINVDTVIA